MGDRPVGAAGNCPVEAVPFRDGGAASEAQSGQAPAATVIGEALIDLVRSGPPGAFQAHPGGSPYNVAIGLARLGHRTSLMARLADDAFGRILRTHAEDEGVGLEAAPRAAEPTTLAVVSVNAHAQATYDFYVEGTADWQWTAAEVGRAPVGTQALHFGSIASWTSPGADHIHELAARLHRGGDVLISYDPNVRPRLVGDDVRARRLVERSVAATNVVKASREDLAFLYPGARVDDVSARWLDLGPQLVVITDGAAGAYAFTAAGGRLRVPGRPVAVVDTVGAGDALTAGLVGGLLRHGVIAPESLRGCPEPILEAIVGDAVLAAALTCERPGADPPSATELRGRGGYLSSVRRFE